VAEPLQASLNKAEGVMVLLVNELIFFLIKKNGDKTVIKLINIIMFSTPRKFTFSIS
jgi:hypothetical protein